VTIVFQLSGQVKVQLVDLEVLLLRLLCPPDLLLERLQGFLGVGE
jgi:hypothetical protein